MKWETDLLKDIRTNTDSEDVDVWNPQEKYMNDVENLKCLEFEVSPGFMLYVPPYWFYSIKYGKCGPNLTPEVASLLLLRSEKLRFSIKSEEEFEAPVFKMDLGSGTRLSGTS